MVRFRFSLWALTSSIILVAVGLALASQVGPFVVKFGNFRSPPLATILGLLCLALAGLMAPLWGPVLISFQRPAAAWRLYLLFSASAGLLSLVVAATMAFDLALFGWKAPAVESVALCVGPLLAIAAFRFGYAMAKARHARSGAGQGERVPDGSAGAVAPDHQSP